MPRKKSVNTVVRPEPVIRELKSVSATHPPSCKLSHNGVKVYKNQKPSAFESSKIQTFKVPRDYLSFRGSDKLCRNCDFYVEICNEKNLDFFYIHIQIISFR